MAQFGCAAAFVRSRALSTAAASRRCRCTTIALAAALAAGTLVAQPVVVGPIGFDEPEFPPSFNELTLTTLGGVAIPRLTFRSDQALGPIDELEEALGEDLASPLSGTVLVGGNDFQQLRLEFGGAASVVSFDFGMAILPFDAFLVPHGLEVRLFDGNGALVGSGSAANVFTETDFGTTLSVSSAQPFRAAEITGFFEIPATDVVLYLDNLSVTLVPDVSPPVTVGPEELISTGGELPVIAIDPAGRRAVAWEDSAGGSREIFAQLFDANGAPLGDEFRVNARSSADDLAPSIAFDANGEVVVTWLRETAGAASAGAAGSILARRFDPSNGNPQSGETVVAQGAATPPTVDASAGGDAVVTWHGGNSVLGRRLDRQGTPQGGAFDVSASSAASAVRVAAGAAGDFVVVWAEPGGNGAGPGDPGLAATAAAGSIVARFFDASGAPKGQAGVVSTPGATAAAPSVAADAAGNAVVVWQQAGAQGNDVLARRFTAGGAARGEPFRVHADAAGEQTAPSVALNAAGDIVVAWESAPGGSGGSSSAAATSVVARVFDGSSLAAGEQVVVAEVEGGATPGAPQVAIDDSDDATVVYQRKTSGGGDAGLFSSKVSASLPPAPCVAGQETLCLAGGRFEVRVSWRDFSGNTGVARAEPLSGDTGYFWFFEPSNVEIVLKVLDARVLNGYFWVYYGALSDVEYTITVHDTVTGLGKTYFNPASRFASAGDSTAIPGSAGVLWESGDDAAAVAAGETAAASGACTAGPTTLCLQQSRFAVSIAWKDFEGQTGQGQAVGLTGDTGTFWFFDPANVEVVVKVLDGRVLNDRFWVFYGALSNVEFTLTVTDTVTGNSKSYVNPLGVFASVGDTAALPAN